METSLARSWRSPTTAATWRSRQPAVLLSFADEDDNGNEELTFPAFVRALTGKQLDQRVTPTLLKTFTILDANNDGFVDRTDLQQAIDSGVRLRKVEAEVLMQEADKDGDSRISLTEYCAIFAREIQMRLSPEDEKALREVFAQLDDNGDGYISRSELKSAVLKLGTNNKGLLQALLKADVNGDGSISFEEFVRSLVV